MALMDTVGTGSRSLAVQAELRRFIHATNDIEQENWAKQLELIKTHLSALLERAGMRYFHYVIDQPAVDAAAFEGVSTVMLSSFPQEWRIWCGENGFGHHNPVVYESIDRKLPFSWSELSESVRIGDRDVRFFAEAERHGIRGAVTFPIHLPHETAALTVVPESVLGEVEDDQMLHLLAYYLHLAARRPLYEVAMTTPGRRQSLLSPRETEVLEGTANGMTTSRISGELNISEKSVEFHMEGARRKLQSSSRAHAVAKAVALGLLRIL
ncbi:autoinducer binding domain-containing protein [Streptomyces sp. NPDC048643]|uniref:helix-turn-helix transcriptional regulator n=1 Tax=Streptomyces sp. NPDC048643 TaxID=3155637 RepID=UPI00341BFC56